MSRLNRLKEGGSHEGEDTTRLSFIIHGEVERITYEPAMNIKSLFTKYHFLGWLAVEVSKESEICGYVQYRITVSELEGVALDSFVTVGASCGDRESSSRRELVKNANSEAAHNFVVLLLQHLLKKYRWNLPSRSKNATLEEQKNLTRLINSE